MNEKRYIELIEKYFAEEISEEEKVEMEKIFSQDARLRKEFEEQKKVREALKKMKLKEPPREAWDNYWTHVYNRVERKIAWVLISIAAIVLLSYSAIESIENLLRDVQTPAIVKYAIFVLSVGLIILFVSLVREKFFVSKHDKYKEVQR
jgi:elongation factor P--beta-lysine ligase